jgi:anti-sigma B factor antagonist
MKIDTEERGAHTVVRMRGTVALGETTRGLGETLTRIEKEKAGAAIVDLTEVKSLDSTALGLLVGSLRRLHAGGREMVLVNPNERVAMLLHVTQLDSLFSVQHSLVEAFDTLERKTGGVTDRDDRRRDRV